MKRILIMFLFLFTCVLTGCMQETAEKNEGSKPAVRKAGERMVKTVNGIEYAFRWCPAGTFTMGSPEDEPGRLDDETQHSVTLTRGFWMLETEVTQAMWESVMGTSIRQQHDKANTSWPLRGEGSDYPMYYVSWEECRSFCEKLSEKLGLTVSLPTEAQWEYACRAGTTGAYAGDLGKMGWYDKYWGIMCRIHPVGQKKPNAWGLYDMHGNVYEWCQDTYDISYYTESPTSDPTGPNSGSDRVLRGGSWRSDARHCRSADRSGFTPDSRNYYLGFRPVLASPAPEEAKAEETAEENEGSKPAVRKAGERMVKTVNGIEYAFRWCPAGTFTMGSPSSEPDRDGDETQHSVTLTRGFWMLETEVTQAMWESVMGTTLEEQAQKMLHDDTEYDLGGKVGKKTVRDRYGYQRDDDPAETLVGVGSDRPMYYVSWNECEEFCRKLSSKLGMTVSLPTEAQWEYACRAGTTSAYAGDLGEMGWYIFNCGIGNLPVGQKKPNAWGLYDMHGNECEWCQDWYDYDYYTESPTSDPTGPNSGSDRVYRGGCWSNGAQGCRSAYRGRTWPGVRHHSLGFRPVLASPVPEE